MKGGAFFLVVHPVTVVINLDMTRLLGFLLPTLDVDYRKKKQTFIWGLLHYGIMDTVTKSQHLSSYNYIFTSP